ncbi:porin [Emticicia agri]|uniref:Porin n=1 Tax=Emticicia agri TaxID=2492393 RepID=A0A4Q5M3Z9_9BACT|nr:porin [Emticicia agri]RYU97054.1 porin [Emticicia agri]
MKKLLLTAFVFMILKANAQETPNPLTFSGYVETYYSYDFSNPANHEKSFFLYNHNRHNELNLNLGLLKANYTTDKMRANLGIMLGTYAQYNLAAEQGLLKNLYEANIGVKISRKSNLWIDAGVMPSHIGFESAIGKDSWNLTRSLLAENSPYYESGVRVSYTSANEKWYLAGLVLNGWQRIQRVPGNQTPAFGTQLTYKPNSNVTLNWSTYVGNEQPDSASKWRYFNNLYSQFQLNEKFGLTAGFDFGYEQKSNKSTAYNVWLTPILIARYAATDKFRIAARAEYYQDTNGVIIATGTPYGFQTFGYSVNLDYAIIDNLLWRAEGRILDSKDKIFADKNQNFYVTSVFCFSF